VDERVLYSQLEPPTRTKDPSLKAPTGTKEGVTGCLKREAAKVVSCAVAANSP